MNVVLSICIAAYNQYQLVKKSLDELVQYSEDNIEIVVSDDGSQDDLGALVRSYDDPRMKYTRTEKNAGHDLNIIHALRNSSADFAMILRSRDMVSSNQIQRVVEEIEKNSEAAYMLFSAVDENNKPRMVLSDKRYGKGAGAIEASTKLLIHPSGQIYNLRKLELDNIEQHIKNCFQDKFGFEAHNLIRMQLAEKGDFLTFSSVGWIYVNTFNAKDVAQNSSDRGISVYAPYYEYKRYKCEFDYIHKYISNEYRVILYKHVIKRFYQSIMINFSYENKNKKSQEHYNFNSIEYSRKDEWKKFKSFSNRLFEDEPDKKVLLKMYLYALRFISIRFMLSSLVYRCFGRNKCFICLYRKIKRV